VISPTPSRRIVLPSLDEVMMMSPFGIGLGGYKSGSASTMSNPTAATQYDDDTALVVSGVGFTASTQISIDGTPYTTTFDSSTQVTVTVPGARTVGSPLRTSGPKALTANTGGSATWTVNAWTPASETDCSGLWVGSSANMGGLTTYGAGITTWTDLKGVANLTGGATKPWYVPANYTSDPAYWEDLPSAYCYDTTSMTRSTLSLGSGGYLLVIALTQFLDSNERRVIRFANGALERILYMPGGGGRAIRWRDQPNNATAPADVTTATLGANGTRNTAIYTAYRSGSDQNVYLQRNVETALSATGDNSPGAAAGVLTLGAPSALAECTVPFICTYSAGATEAARLRTRNYAMIMTGLA
jgi:hypothetical protein